MKKLKLTKVIASLLIVSSILALNPIAVSAEWKSDSKGWWYTEGNSWATGWKLIDGNWYYFNDNGYMATIENINGYFVNSGGVWTNAITESEARELILKEDSNYISNKSSEWNIVLSAYDSGYGGMPKAWNIPQESCYSFVAEYHPKDGGDWFEGNHYLVGKESKNVYIIGGNTSLAYQIKNNQKVKTFKSILNGASSIEWR